MKDEARDSFVRWQSITIKQFTYAINLILGFSVATLGFQATLLLNDQFQPLGCLQRLSFLSSIIFLILSIVVGLWVVINRLDDFRETAKAARKIEEGASEDEIAIHRVRYRILGNRTWCLFRWQIVTFSFGILLTFLSVAASAMHKLL